MFKKALNLLIIICMLLAFIPFGNFAQVKAENNLKKEKVTTQEPIELMEERTANSKTYDNLDGTLSTEITQTPQHYQNAKGYWKEIDNTLISHKEGKVKNKENAFTVEFDEKLTPTSTGMQIHEESYNINLQLTEVDNEISETVQPTTGEITDNQIVYPEVFKDISASYTIGENYVKEDIILDSYPENGLPKKFIYTLDLQGLTYKVIGNQIYLYDVETKEANYLIEAPFMYDAYTPADFKAVSEVDAIPEEAKSYKLALNVTEKDHQLLIELVPDFEWLSAPERQYPIVIDPMITRLQGSAEMDDTTIRSNAPTTTGGNDKELGVGTAADGNTVRSLLKFHLKHIPSSAEILSAKLNLYLTSSNNSETAVNIRVHEMTNSWKENEASWKYNQISPYTQWSTHGGDFDTEKMDVVRDVKEVPTTIEDALKQWTIPTDIVKKWIRNDGNNHGLLLKSSTEATKVYKKFASSEGNHALQYQPKLVVTYKTPSRLGLENYWDYKAHPLNSGTQYINLGTLNNILQYHDVSLLNYADFGLDFTRTYNSKDYEKSAFGYGWTFTGDQKLFIETNDKGVYYKDADGTTHFFTDNGSNLFTSPIGIYDTLEKISDSIYKLSSPEGIVTTFTVKEFTSDTNVKVAYITEEKDLNGNTIKYLYDTSNQLISIFTNADPNNQKLELTYQNGLISTITHQNKQFTYGYTNGYLTSVKEKKSTTDSTLTTTTYTYTNNLITNVTDPNGNTTTFSYTDNLDIDKVSVNGSTAATTQYTLNRTTTPKQTVVTSPEGEITTYSLNDNYVVAGIRQGSGERTTYTFAPSTYNVTKEVVQYTDGKSFTTNYTYDLYGNVLTTKDSDNITTSTTYNSRQSILTETDATGDETSYEYDTKNNLTKVIWPDKSTTQYSYSPNGELTKITDANGNTQTFKPNFVNGGKTTVSKDEALDISSTTVTDSSGNIVSQTDGKNITTYYCYNLKDELVSVSKVADCATSINQYTYDSNGNLTTIKNAANKVTALAYTTQNQVKSETDALSRTTSYTYNDDEELTKISRPNGNTIAYDNNEETGTSTIKLNGSSIAAYTTQQNGLVTTVTNHGANQAVEYTSSEDGLLKQIRFNGLALNAITYNYTDEQLTSLAYGGQTYTYTYTPNGQTSTINVGSNVLASHTYDKNGLVTSTSFGTGGTAKILNTYKVGPTGKATTQLQTETLQTNDANAAKTIVNQYSYDANNQITSIVSKKGTVASTTSYTYDSNNQLTQEKLSNNHYINYTYDNVGNRTAKSVVKNGVTTTTNYAFNAANQMTKAGSISYEYEKDANGKIVGNIKNDGRYQYTWNALDQLTTVKDSAGNTMATYEYDENGRRIYSKVDNTETYYRYDGTSNHVLFEEDAKGNITKSYTYDDNGYPLTMTFKNKTFENKTYYYLTNYRGDVLALTNASGTVVAEYTYDAWGNILSQSGEMASTNPYRYAGYRYDEETKLYYLMARYYNPDTGVFLSLDPVRGETMNPITMNGYNYANNNPVMMVDPDGEWAKKLMYAAITGITYFIKENLKGLITVGGIVKIIKDSWVAYRDAIKGQIVTYSDLINTKKSKQAMKTVQKVARKAALKAGARAFVVVGIAQALAQFGYGAHLGWKHYEKYENTSFYNYGIKIYNKYGAPGWL